MSSEPKAGSLPWVVRYYTGFFSSPWTKSTYEPIVRPLLRSILSIERGLARMPTDSLERMAIDVRRKGPLPEQIMEVQLGLPLVACQTYLTRIVATVGYVHSDFGTLLNRDVHYPSKGKRELMASFGRPITSSRFTDIEILDGLANYFKHHDEWGSSRRSLDRRSLRTIEIVQELCGETHWSFWVTNRLQRGLGHLGIRQMRDARDLLRMIDAWKRSIGEACSNELDWPAYGVDTGVALTRSSSRKVKRRR